MVVSIGLPDSFTMRPKITVLGIGGAGGNAVNNMIRSGLIGVDFVVANTDAQALESSLCQNRIQLGIKKTKGLGAGAVPEVGRLSVKESSGEVVPFFTNTNLVFITAGFGGGTGTGGAQEVAKLLKKIQEDDSRDDSEDRGIMDLIPDDLLVVGVVTKPFDFEGSKRMLIAELGIEGMQKYVDTLIVLPNQYLFRVINEKTTFQEAFRHSDAFLTSSVREISNLIIKPGLINLDFADIKTIMSERGKAMIGVGSASGDNRAVMAADAAISNPLLDNSSMKGAKGVLINISGGDDMTLFEVDAAANRVKDEVDADANIIFGSTFDAEANGSITVSVVATGIDSGCENIRRSRVQNQDRVIVKNRALVSPDGEYVDNNVGAATDFNDGSFISKRKIVDPEVDEVDDIDDEENTSNDAVNRGFFSSFNGITDSDVYTKKNTSAISDIPAFLRRNKK